MFHDYIKCLYSIADQNDVSNTTADDIYCKLWKWWFEISFYWDDS